MVITRVLIGLMALLTPTLISTPTAGADADGWCAQLGGSWDGTACTALIISQRKAEMLLSLALPPEQLGDDPVAGPVLHDYYRRLSEGWRATGLSTPRDSSARAAYEMFTGPGGVQSVVVHETFEPFGLQANNAFRSFVFDLAAGRRLTLTDIFRPGTDAVAAVSAAAAPLLPAALDAAAPPHAPGTYPFTVREWQPSLDGGGYSGDYRAFALTSDALILYMPDQPMQRENPSPPDRFVWSMDGGTVRIAVPLSALSGSLQPRYGGAT